MNVKYGSDSLPLCPDCSIQMDHEPANGRDDETMGGLSVEYFKCDNCKERFEVINECVYPCSS
jgi:hypothetical protein